MKKFAFYLTFGIIIACAIGMIKHDSVNAVNYVSGASINGHVGQPGHTRFRVNLHFTSACNGADIQCKQVDGKFPCIEHGDDYTDSICSNREWAHSGNPQSDGWDYYEVVLYPCDSNEQNMQGTYKVRHRYTLTLKSVEQGTNKSLANVTGLGDKTAKAWSGNTASITRGSTNTGYTFVGFSDGTAGDTISKKLTSNATVYAYYRGESGSSSTNIKVKNTSVSKYNKDNQTVVYAKPGTVDNHTGDTLTYTAYYSAGAQSGANYRPQLVEIGKNGSWGNACGNNNTLLTLSALFNQCKSGNENFWNNAFSVTKENFKAGGAPIDYTGYNIGSSTGETNGKSNNHTVIPQEVGSALIEHAVTNRDYAVKTTPKSYTIGLSSDKSSGKVDITSLDSAAEARIPYNFKNTPHKPNKPSDNPDGDSDDNVDDNDNGKIVYAGEEDTFEFTIDVKPRNNPETNGTYATIVDKAKWRLGLCIGASCNKPDDDDTKYTYSQEWGGTPSDRLNTNYKLEGETGIKKSSLNINIPDLTAGSRICVVAEVFPKTSGSPLNWNNTNYDGTWDRSPKSCYTVAKRPSIQVWSGNVYSRANLVTDTAIKNNLADYSQYSYVAKVTSNQPAIAFGSWGELGVVSNGSIDGFGSGASMGYASNNGELSPNPLKDNQASTTPDPGGSKKKSFCNRIPLTIPNASCTGSGPAGGLTSAVGITKAASDKESIVDLLASGDSTANHTHSSSSMILNKAIIGSTIENSNTKVFSAESDITITADGGDLDYLNSTYLTYSQMPKLIIYSKTNINISCDINRIDALLIANDTVNTCADSDNINSQKNSRQLFINGAIIAKRLIANRTYGAATGANSIVPAEIINFDPTLYQFGSSAEADDDATGRLDITYTHELAPRF